jgi:RNA polymerase sigma-70 factor (ECF subfamily)
MDSEKLADLFRKYGDDVFRLAYSYLGSRADGEDVCQSVFLKLAEGKTVLLPGKEKSWLLTCAANLCKSQLRSFWRRNVGELDETLPFREQSDQELWDAVMALPPKYRAVIHLYYWEGYDQGEIGEILHLSRTAVQTRMSRARDMLRKELSDDEQLLAHDGTGHAE